MLLILLFIYMYIKVGICNYHLLHSTNQRSQNTDLYHKHTKTKSYYGIYKQKFIKKTGLNCLNFNPLTSIVVIILSSLCQLNICIPTIVLHRFLGLNTILTTAQLLANKSATGYECICCSFTRMVLNRIKNK